MQTVNHKPSSTQGLNYEPISQKLLLSTQTIVQLRFESIRKLLNSDVTNWYPNYLNRFHVKTKTVEEKKLDFNTALI